MKAGLSCQLAEILRLMLGNPRSQLEKGGVFWAFPESRGWVEVGRAPPLVAGSTKIVYAGNGLQIRWTCEGSALGDLISQ